MKEIERDFKDNESLKRIELVQQNYKEIIMENTDSLLFFIFESISSWKHMFLQASHDSMSMKNTLQFFLAMIHLVGVKLRLSQPKTSTIVKLEVLLLQKKHLNLYDRK